MNEQEHDKELLLFRNRFLLEICLGIQDTQQLRLAVQIRPNLSMMLGNRDQVTDAPDLGVDLQGETSKEQPRDNAEALNEGKPVLSQPGVKSH